MGGVRSGPDSLLRSPRHVTSVCHIGRKSFVTAVADRDGGM
ncbi:hypothetical protein T261_02168 [Streptomyces lydicus]|nr:hypothetical protein T261_02168 [Streptomyces lydicus]